MKHILHTIERFYVRSGVYPLFRCSLVETTQKMFMTSAPGHDLKHFNPKVTVSRKIGVTINGQCCSLFCYAAPNAAPNAAPYAAPYSEIGLEFLDYARITNKSMIRLDNSATACSNNSCQI